MCPFVLEIMIQIDSLTAMIRYMDEQEPGKNHYDCQKDSRGECSGTRTCIVGTLSNGIHFIAAEGGSDQPFALEKGTPSSATGLTR